MSQWPAFYAIAHNRSRLCYPGARPIMPDKPTWCGDLEGISVRLRALACPWVDRQTVQELLGVGRRRAQQILASCSSRRIGSSLVADRDALVAHLDRLARGEARYYEHRRRLRLARTLTELNQAWCQGPRLLLEAPAALAGRGLGELPAGVRVAPGEITVRFETVPEALEKLLALGLAIGNDLESFEQLTVTDRQSSREL